MVGAFLFLWLPRLAPIWTVCITHDGNVNSLVAREPSRSGHIIFLSPIGCHLCRPPRWKNNIPVSASGRLVLGAYEEIITFEDGLTLRHSNLDHYWR